MAGNFQRLAAGSSRTRAARTRVYAPRSGGAAPGEARDTDHIYTETERAEGLESNREAATKLRAQYANMLPQRDDAALQDIEQGGVASVLRGVGSVAEAIDRARKLVQLGIRDFAAVDTEKGNTEITAGHYWDVAMGRTQETVENLGADLVGEHGDLSTANLLDGAWDKTDNVFNNIARGAASFVGDVATDPLTYVTAGASAVGSKAALGSMRAVTATATRTSMERAIGRSAVDVAETGFERVIREGIEEAAEPIYESMLKEATEAAAEEGVRLTSRELDELFEASIRKAAGVDDEFIAELGDVGSDAWKNAVANLNSGEFARRVDALAEPIAKRDWSNLPTEYIDHVFTVRDGKRLGQAFTTGGMRIGVPFSAAKTTRAIPGTRGLSKKLPGVAQFRKFNEGTVGRKFASMLPLINAEAPILQAARRGEGYAMMSYAENLVRAAGREVGNAADQRATLMAAQSLDQVMSEAAVSAADKDEMWRLIFPSMQVGQVAPDITNKFSPEVAAAAQEFIDSSHATLGRAYQFLKALDPNGIGFIENHIPLMFGDDFARAVRSIADSPKGFPFSLESTNLDASVRKVAGELGVDEDEVWLWLEAYDGLTGFGSKEGRNIGSKAVVRKRRAGRTAVSRRGTFSSVDENGNMVFMRNPLREDPEIDPHVQRVASGEYADEVRNTTAGYTAVNEDAVPQLISSIKVTESRLPARRLVGVVDSPKTGESFRVYRAAEEDRYAYSVVRESTGEVMGGVIGSGTNFSMGLASDARGVMDQVWDLALENGHDLMAIHGRGASTSEDALLFAQRRAQRMVEEAGSGTRLSGDTLTEEVQGAKVWMDQSEMSDALAKVTNAMNERYGLGLKPVQDGLVRDPVKLVGDYLSQMTALAQQRALRKAATHLGGITQIKSARNLEGVLAQLGDTTPTVVEMYQRIAAENEQSIVDILSEKRKVAKIDVGGGRHMSMPKELAEHKRMKPLLNRLRKMNARIEGQARTLQKLRAREARHLVERTGVEPQTAADIIAATTGDVAKLRAEYLAEVDQITSELQEHMIEVWFRTARDGVDGEEALAVAVAYRHDLRVQARAALSDAEDAWAAQFPEFLDELTEIDVPLRGFNYDDPVQYAEGVRALLGPVIDHMAAVRNANLEALASRHEALALERAELMGRLGSMGAEKNTRSLTVGPGMQQNRVTLEARVNQIDRQVTGIERLMDYQANARSGDDIHLTQMVQEVVADLTNEATFEAADSWDTVLLKGIERVRALLDAGALDDATARSATKAIPHIEAQWDAFVEGVQAGTAKLSDEVFDSPWFWRTLANGYLADREANIAVRETARGVLQEQGIVGDEAEALVRAMGAAFDFELFDKVRGAVDQRIARIEKLAADAPTSGSALEQLADMYDALPNRRSTTSILAASADERNAMVEELLQHQRLRAAALDADDEEMWINQLGKYLRAYMGQHQENLTGRVAMVMGEQEFGGNALALDRVITDMLQAPYDQAAALRAIKNQELLNDAFQRVYQDKRIRLVLSGKDGFRIRVSELRPTRAQRPPDPKQIMDLLREGKVTPAQLRDNQLGYVADLWDVRRAFEEAQKTVARQRGVNARQMARSVRVRQNYEQLLDVVLDARGSGKPRKLREWVHTGTSTGAIVKTEQFAELLRELPEHEAAKLERLVSHTLVLTEAPSAEARRIARLVDEEYWSEALFRPAKETVETIEALRDDLLQETIDVRIGEVQGFQQLADDFLNRVIELQDLGRELNDRGLARAGNRVIENTVLPDGRTADQALKDLKAAAEALEGVTPAGLSKTEIKAFLARIDDGVESIRLPSEGFVPAESVGLGGQLAGYEVDPLVAATFRNMVASHEMMFTPQGLSQMRSASREMLRWWRGAATIARIPFHARNVISAVANGMLISTGPKNYAAVMPDYVAYRRALRAGTDPIEAVSPANRAMFQAALDEEVIGSGFVRSELGVALGTGGARKKANPLDADNFILFRGGAEMMQTLEDSVRLAAFHRWFDDAVPESASFARQMVMVAHFDYQHLGELEQKFKAVAPFFVWTRRNVPLQLRAIYENPAYLQTFNHASQAARDNFGSGDDSPYGEYTGSFAFPLPFDQTGDEETWARWILDPDLPFSNLEDLPLFANRREGNVLPLGGGAFSPTAWASWGAQLLAPQWSFAGESVYGEEYETNAPTGLNEVLRLLNTVDFFDMIPDPSQSGQVRVGNLTAGAFRTAMPFLPEYTDFFGGGAPTREARLGFDNEAESIGDRLKAFAQAQFGSGVGLERQTPTDARGRIFDAQEYMQQVARSQREKLPTP